MTAEADRGERRRTGRRVVLRVLVLLVVVTALVAFSLLLAKVTLTPSPASEDLVRSNLRPGRSLRQYAEEYTFLAACKQAGGNLLLGVPFGLLLPILVPRRMRMVRMALLTALVMVLIELVQGALVTGRAFDVDDVILNTAGALLGYLLLGRRISHRYHVMVDGDDEARRRPRARTGPVGGNDLPWPGRRRSERDPSGAAAPRTPLSKPFMSKSARTRGGWIDTVRSRSVSGARRERRTGTGRSLADRVRDRWRGPNAGTRGRRS
ncbi:VanZ family protein [Streptomyces sp. DT171]|uniref:VanZ family protein n=1 Tax=Streptomyces sp. DT171 TaxID=3416524 RepID=UPI003CEEDBA1